MDAQSAKNLTKSTIDAVRKKELSEKQAIATAKVRRQQREALEVIEYVKKHLEADVTAEAKKGKSELWYNKNDFKSYLDDGTLVSSYITPLTKYLKDKGFKVEYFSDDSELETSDIDYQGYIVSTRSIKISW